MKNTRTVRRALARSIARRWFLRDCGVGLGGMALSSLLTRDSSAAPANDLFAPRAPHFAPKAKRVVYLFQAGAPSQLELFDPKPVLARLDGKLPPAHLLEGYRAAFIKPNSSLLGPRFKFAPRGNSGIEVGELLPHIGALADELCFIRSMHTEAVNHAPAQIFMNTGSQQFGRPSLGSWTLYGLGSES